MHFSEGADFTHAFRRRKVGCYVFFRIHCLKWAIFGESALAPFFTAFRPDFIQKRWGGFGVSSLLALPDNERPLTRPVADRFSVLDLGSVFSMWIASAALSVL